MRHLLLMLLTLANVALLAALMTGGRDGQALAQMRGSADFTAVTVKIDADEDAQFIIDPRTNYLFGMRTDTSRKSATIEVFGARDLTRDFPTTDAGPETQSR